MRRLCCHWAWSHTTTSSPETSASIQGGKGRGNKILLSVKKTAHPSQQVGKISSQCIIGPNLCCANNRYFFPCMWSMPFSMIPGENCLWYFFLPSSASNRRILRVNYDNLPELCLESMGNADASKTDLEFLEFRSRSFCLGDLLQGKPLAASFLKASRSPLSIHQVFKVWEKWRPSARWGIQAAWAVNPSHALSSN